MSICQGNYAYSSIACVIQSVCGQAFADKSSICITIVVLASVAKIAKKKYIFPIRKAVSLLHIFFALLQIPASIPTSKLRNTLDPVSWGNRQLRWCNVRNKTWPWMCLTASTTVCTIDASVSDARWTLWFRSRKCHMLLLNIINFSKVQWWERGGFVKSLRAYFISSSKTK